MGNHKKMGGKPNQGKYNSPLQYKLITPIQTVGSIIRGIKSASTHQIRLLLHNPSLNVWQRNYYEHVIRNETEYEIIKGYIWNNPMRWEFDRDMEDKLEM